LRDGGYRPKTIKGYVQILKYCAKSVDLLNPAEVRSIQKISKSRNKCDLNAPIFEHLN
jgi:hypothetical protein